MVHRVAFRSPCKAQKIQPMFVPGKCNTVGYMTLPTVSWGWFRVINQSISCMKSGRSCLRLDSSKPFLLAHFGRFHCANCWASTVRSGRMEMKGTSEYVFAVQRSQVTGETVIFYFHRLYLQHVTCVYKHVRPTNDVWSMCLSALW